ncbi:uncharacterized protein LOC143247398 [Tachypleus tridentatus]|uniref:uncharacterized protein LOC143247398 n=1 Tax=Tachypleus tridentatus TaxID=6853 RepID=UPI003FD5632D
MGCGQSKDMHPSAAKGYLLEKIVEHKEGINCMALSEDGSLLVTGSEDKTAKMWSTQSNPIELLGTLEGHTGYITCCAVHEQFVVTGSSDNTLRKWSIATSECLYVYEGHESRISRVICTGDFIFSTSYDKTARSWLFDINDIGDGQNDACIKVFEGHNRGVYPIIFIPAEDNPLVGQSICVGDILITGSADCTARSWSFDTGTCLQVFKGHKLPVNALVTDTNAKCLYTGGGDGMICCWSISTGELLQELRGHEGPIFSLLVHNRMMYSCSSDQTARAWVMEFGECTRIYRNHKHTVSSIRYLDGILYTGCGDKLARMFEAKSGTLKRTFRGHIHAIMCMEVIKGKLFTGSYDGTIRVWDTTGVKDETVFGADYDENDTIEPQIEDDSEDIQNAMKSLDPYIRE